MFSSPACQVWKDALSAKANSPYLNHEVPGTLRSLAFCPYEDVLAAGHAAGLSTVLIPVHPRLHGGTPSRVYGLTIYSALTLMSHESSIQIIAWWINPEVALLTAACDRACTLNHAGAGARRGRAQLRQPGGGPFPGAARAARDGGPSAAAEAAAGHDRTRPQHHRPGARRFMSSSSGRGDALTLLQLAALRWDRY